MTSRAAGSRVAKMFGVKKFGHLGTLDPMASGVLPIALGQATKMIPYIPLLGRGAERIRGGEGCLYTNEPSPSVGYADCHPSEGGEKEYIFSIVWGYETDTLDVTGTETKRDNRFPPYDEIDAACRKFIGEIDQVPPAYSAVHIGGRRAYELARRGAAVEIPARKITIYALQIVPPPAQPAVSPTPPKGGVANSSHLSRSFQRINHSPLGGSPNRVSDLGGGTNKTSFIVECSTGTYVRSIARDIGAAAGGYLATVSLIRRTRTHQFAIKDAVSLDFLENLVHNAPVDAAKCLHPIDFGLDDILVLNLNSNDAKLFQNGGFITPTQDLLSDKSPSKSIPPPKGAGKVLLRRTYSDGKFIGIGEIEDEILKPKRIINI